MHTKVGIDSDQMRVEGSVVNLRKRNSIRDHWLAKHIVFIGNDVRGVEQ